MGREARLKKGAFNYRRTGNGMPNCDRCEHLVRDFRIWTPGGELLSRIEPRCKLIGLEKNIRYRIRLDHVCDKLVDTFTPPDWVKKAKGVQHVQQGPL